jgi:hypothetical protein
VRSYIVLVSDHHAQVMLVYGTGKPAHGYNSDPHADWGVERRPFYVSWCYCEWEGAMRERAADAFREAHEHTADVEPDIWAHGGKRISK